MQRRWHKHYPEGVPRQVSIPEVPLYRVLEASALRFPEAVALDFFDFTLSYERLVEQVDRLAASLQELGVQPGERVALMLPNSPQFVIAFFACNKIGAVNVPVNPLYTGLELRHQLADAGAETLIVLERLYPAFHEVRAHVPVRRLILTGMGDYLPFPKNLIYPLAMRFRGEWPEIPEDAQRYRFKKLIEDSPGIPTPVFVKPSGTALLQYTGGTSGRPKGVMLSNRNIIANICMLHAWDPELQDGFECFLLVIPFCHVYGLTVGMGLAVASAAKMVILPRFRVKEVLDAIDHHRPTMLPGIPTLYAALAAHPEVEEADLSSLRACISGAAPLPQELKTHFESLTGARLVGGYGLTEASPVSHVNALSGKQVAGSIGLPLPEIDAKVVDENGHEVACGDVGELVLRGPTVMQGYWRRPDETREVLKDDWLYTGDLAVCDEDGYFYIHDRKSDLIIASGYNVYPREIEVLLDSHPAVLEAAVVGVPDDYRGETIKAFVALKDAQQVSEDELLALCRQGLAAYKVPSQIEFRESLPKSATGKILKRELT